MCIDPIDNEKQITMIGFPKSYKEKWKGIYADGLGMTMLSSQQLELMSTEDVTIACAFIGDQPTTHKSVYGQIIGFCYLTTDDHNKGRLFRFQFNVHRPNQKTGRKSNSMTDLEECHLKNHRKFEFMTHTPTNFGSKAFLPRVYSDEYLRLSENPQHYIMRLFLNNVIACSRKWDLCKMLRKTDKEFLKQNPQYV